jgi:predicted RNA binding protein YcfA (HicA-like mRNA interferase family)
MGRKFRVLSGNDIVKILATFGFTVNNQKGSHIKLKRFSNGATETLIIPNHSNLAKGTTKAIFNQCLKFVEKTELSKYFYTD